MAAWKWLFPSWTSIPWSFLNDGAGFCLQACAHVPGHSISASDGVGPARQRVAHCGDEPGNADVSSVHGQPGRLSFGAQWDHEPTTEILNVRSKDPSRWEAPPLARSPELGL